MTHCTFFNWLLLINNDHWTLICYKIILIFYLVSRNLENLMYCLVIHIVYRFPVIYNISKWPVFHEKLDWIICQSFISFFTRDLICVNARNFSIEKEFWKCAKRKTFLFRFWCKAIRSKKQAEKEFARLNWDIKDRRRKENIAVTL